MQIKKEEIRLKILEAATNEFLKRGYENASMRVIAQKAHTTLGNIYHYFPNKEKLLEDVLLPAVVNIETGVAKHLEYSNKISLSKEEGFLYAEHLEQSELMFFFDKRAVIFFRLNSSYLLERKEKVLKTLQEHLQKHFNMEDDPHYSEIILDMFIECVKHVLIEHEDLETAKTKFLTLFKMLCTGIIGQLK